MHRAVTVCLLLAGSVRAGAQPAAPTQGAPAPAVQQPVPPPPLPPTSDGQDEREVAEARCAAHEPSCDWIATLSSLERASVARALVARGYQLEPQPWGKVIGAVRVYNEEVFAERTPVLQFFNYFHITTRESTIRDAAAVVPGEVWDQARIEETARLLRDPLWTSVVAVVPVVAAAPGTVDVLIVTRDIWSLRLNTTYTFQQGKLTNLTTSLSENNFLGRREVLSAALTMDQGSIAVGPLFIDKNLAGEHINVQARVDDILTRDDLFDHSTLHSEGTDSTITVSRPLWSLASEWAAGASFSHRYAINRQFLGTALREFVYTDPQTMQSLMFPREYNMRLWSANAFVTRQWGDALKQQLSIGHTITSQRPTTRDDFGGNAAAREAFVERVLPVNEVTSAPYIEYSFFVPRYRTVHNVTTFDLAEDLRTGPDLDVSLGTGLRFLGSNENFERLNAAAGWTLPWAREGFVRVAGSLAGRYQPHHTIDKHHDTIDDTASVSIRGATPPIASAFRLLAQSSLSFRWHDTQNQFLAIGSDSGLRGYTINQFTGQRYFDLQVEARSLPYAIWVLRVGAVVFYDVGDAAASLGRMTLHQDAGIGLRALIPQTSAQLLKFDFAVPFDAPHTIRFLAGFGSEF